jgi:hypothetical protein
VPEEQHVHAYHDDDKRDHVKSDGDATFHGFFLLLGAALGNRTQDLRITRGMLSGFVRATCTDATRRCCHDTQCTGVSDDLFHDSFHAYVGAWSFGGPAS